MKISEKGKSLIKKYEGCRLTAYKCPAGVLTIGYGHTGSDVTAGLKISQEQADKLFNVDILIHCNNVEKLVKVPLTQNQFDALVSFEYNIGYGQFSKSTLLALLNRKLYKEASLQFERWARGGGKILPGLVKRRAEEKLLFCS